MGEMLGWWLIVELLGIVSAPLAAMVFARLPDRGWALTKPLGLIVVGWLVWFPLSLITALPYSRGWILGTFVVYVLANVALLRVAAVRQALRDLFVRSWRYVAAVEILFAGAFAAMGWERSFTPAVVDTEKFMDVAFLSAIWRAPHLPPPDPWLSGETINYYYFGHFLLATLAKVTGTVPAVAFNLGVALIFALAAVAICAMAANLMSLARSRPLTSPVVIGAGVASVVLTLVAGNLAGAGEWWKEATAVAASGAVRGLTSPWGWWFHRDLWIQFDWWTPSRVISNTINEFPAFSFVLADLHAHVLALPFAAMAVALALNLLLSDGQGLGVFGDGWLGAIPLVVTAIVIGGLYAINGWDLPTYLGLALLALLIQQWLAHERQFTTTLLLNVCGAGALLAALCVLLYVPFYRGFTSPSEGIGVVPFSQHTTIGDEFAVFGLPLFLVLSLLIVRIVPMLGRMTNRWLSEDVDQDGAESEDDQRAGPFVIATGAQTLLIPGAILVGLTALTRGFGGWTVFWALLVIVACALVALSSLRRDDGAARDAAVRSKRADAWIWCMAGTAVALVAACEVVYLRDIFGGGDGQLGIDFRMNTVFKLYYQAWLLFGIISGPCLIVVASKAFAALRSSLGVGSVERAEARTGLAAPLALAGGGNLFDARNVLSHRVMAFARRDVGDTWPAKNASRATSGTDGGRALRWPVVGGIVLWIALCLLLLGAGAIYPVLAVSARTQNFTLPRTLDGTAYMAGDATNMGDAEAIAWLNAHVQGDPVIVEAAKYDEYTHYGRVSAFTGLPTLLGWGGHEVQWRINWLPSRGDVIGTRLKDVTTIYTDTDDASVLALLHQYSVRYVYVGQAEQEQFPDADLTRFSRYLRVVYRTSEVTIYAVP